MNKETSTKNPIGNAHAHHEHGDCGCSQPAKKNGAKVGRNDPCLCGSGKKYKKCCISLH